MFTMIILILILLVAAFQVFRQGLFSSALTAILAMACSLVAFNYYEILANLISNYGAAPYCPHTVCFLGSFAILFFVLRTLTDKYIRGNMKFPLLADRIGSAFFGLLAGTVISGVVAIGLQLLPVSAVILNYNRYPNLQDPEEVNHLVGRPAGFVVSLIGIASGNGFSGSNTFWQMHPDLLRELYMNRLALDPASRREAAPDSLQIVHARLTEDILDPATGEPMNFKAKEMGLIIGFELKPGADTKKNRGAKDIDNQIRFAYGNLHVIGFDPDKQAGGISAYPIAMIYPGGKVARRISLEEGKVLTSGKQTVDLLFSWPRDTKTFPPQHLVFKGTAFAALGSAKKLEEAAAPTEDIFAGIPVLPEAGLASSGVPGEKKYYQKIIVVADRQAQPLREMEMPVDTKVNAAKKDGKLNELEYENQLLSNQFEYKQVHFVLPLSGDLKQDDDKSMPFHIPEGYALVMVSFSEAKAEDLTIPCLIDHNAQLYKPAGWWIKGKAGSETLGELAYDSTEPAKGFANPGAFQSKPLQDLKGYFLYLVPNASPIGIIGCRSQKGQGPFYPVEEMNIVVVPKM